MRYLFVLLIAGFCAAEPVIHPGGAQPLLDQGYRQMYDLQFADAHNTFHQFEREHPADPMGPASDAAAYLFSEFDRLHILQSEFFTHDQHFITDHKLTPDPALKQQFDTALDRAQALAAQSPEDKNSQFASILARGLRSNYMALIEKRYAAALSEMKSGRAAAEKLLAADPTFYDAWLAVGVENYMLSIKSAPVRFFLRLSGAETDRATGIAKLKLTAEKGHYLAPFAKLLLGVAAMRDHDTRTAGNILTELARTYPNNPLYRQELARLDPMASRSMDN